MTKKDQVEIEEVVLDKTPAEKIDTSSLIVVKQIPIIEERLQEIKGAIQSEVDNALSFECTEENKQEIKKLRTNLSKQYKLLETDRKKIKDIVLGPYNAFEATYKECVTNIFKPADIQLKNKIDAVEATQKKAKKSKAVEFFNEYAAAHGIDFITFDDVGVEVTLSISDKKLKETCKTFIDMVVGDLALINTQDDQADILVEYKKSLDVSKAITSVKIRKKAIEEEAKRIEEATKKSKAEAEREHIVNDIIAQEHKAVDETPMEAPVPIEAPISVPTIDEPKEKLYNVRFAFQLYGISKEKAIAAKTHFEDYLKKEGIDYAITK